MSNMGNTLTWQLLEVLIDSIEHFYELGYIPSGFLSSFKTASCAARAIVRFFAMGKNASGSVISHSADRLFFEFLRSLSPGGECLIELKHWRFCLFSEIEFLDEFSRLTRTDSGLFVAFCSRRWKLSGRRVFLFVECLWPLGWVKNCFSFIDMDMLTRFFMEERFFWKDD